MNFAMLKTVPVIKQFVSTQKLGLSYAKDRVLLSSELSLIVNPCRTTFVLRRKYPTHLVKKTADQNKWKLMKRRDNVYELEEHLDFLADGEISVILTSYVEGLGEKGDLVTVKRKIAYNQLLLPGLAEYATPEAIKNLKVKEKKVDGNEERLYSGIHVHRTMNVLSSMIIGIVMNKENKWVLEPWHVKASFRKAGVHLTEDCIQMPKVKIEGPDMNLEAKEFFVNVIINKKETVEVRCRIHHWSTDIIHRLPNIPHHWTLPAEPLFKEEAEKLSSLPLPPVPKTAEAKIIY